MLWVIWPYIVVEIVSLCHARHIGIVSNKPILSSRQMSRLRLLYFSIHLPEHQVICQGIAAIPGSFNRQIGIFHKPSLQRFLADTHECGNNRLPNKQSIFDVSAVSMLAEGVRFEPAFQGRLWDAEDSR